MQNIELRGWIRPWGIPAAFPYLPLSYGPGDSVIILPEEDSSRTVIFEAERRLREALGKELIRFGPPPDLPPLPDPGLPLLVSLTPDQVEVELIAGVRRAFLVHMHGSRWIKLYPLDLAAYPREVPVFWGHTLMQRIRHEVANHTMIPIQEISPYPTEARTEELDFFFDPLPFPRPL